MTPNGRLIDIPYSKSPPVIFTYRRTAQLAVGQYDFGGVSSSVVRTEFTPSRPLLPNVLYMFDTISFAADVTEGDFQGAIATTPAFQVYNRAEAGAVALREAISLDAYLQVYPYRLAIMGSTTTNAGSGNGSFNRLLGSITGVLNQTVALVGKAEITMLVKMTAQEISDTEYIRQFTGMGLRQGLPQTPPAGRVW